MKRTVERIPLPPKLIRVMELIREEIRGTDKKPYMCIKGYGLSRAEEHTVLSEFAYHANQVRKAKARIRRLAEEKGAMFSFMRSTFVARPTQTSRPQTFQEDLFPAMLRSCCYQDCHRRRPRRRE